MRYLIPVLLAALLAGGCEKDKVVEYVTVAQTIKPPAPPACKRRNPPRPVIGGGKGLPTLRHIEAADHHIDALEALRDECRAALGG